MAKKAKKPKLQELPIDMMYEIILRLPVETIGRFRLVCKKWNSIISDPTFQQDHYDRSQHQERLLLVTRTTYNHKANILLLSTHDINGGRGMKTLYMKFPLLELPSHEEIQFIQSCRGLVCLAYKKKHMLIGNPLTWEMTALPPIEGDYYYVTIGFGYAAAAKEFKVVRFLKAKEKETKCQIFTWGTGVWREARPPPPQYPDLFQDAPFLHGAIHILPFDDDPNVDLSIYAFDMQTEEYTMIPLPQSYYDAVASGTAGWEVRYLKVLGGFLHLTFNYGDELKLWILKDYNRRMWVEGYTIDLTDIYAITPLAILTDRSMLLDVVDEVDEYGWVLYRYSPGDGGFEPTSPDDYYCSAIMCEETLFAPWK